MLQCAHLRFYTFSRPGNSACVQGLSWQQKPFSFKNTSLPPKERSNLLGRLIDGATASLILYHKVFDLDRSSIFQTYRRITIDHKKMIERSFDLDHVSIFAISDFKRVQIETYHMLYWIHLFLTKRLSRCKQRRDIQRRYDQHR